jgi:amino acid adenylation domain-containing protein
MNGRSPQEAPQELTREEKVALVQRLLREKERTARTFPLSFAQERMWFLDRLDPANHVNNIFRALTWSGPLDREALRRALGELVRRHEALRTRFLEEGGAPRQRIEVSQDFSLEVEDLEPLPSEGRLPRAREHATSEARRGFDLARGPVFRARLLRLAATEHVLLLSVHHIVADGWSLGLLLSELATLYHAFATGTSSPLPEPALQLADFAVWQRERLSGERLEEELAWWRERLAGFPESIELPTDHPRPPGGSFHGAIEPFTVPRELTAELRRLGRGESATLFMVLRAAFDALLARHAGQDAFLVGTNIAGRNRSELEAVIGFFAETLLLRARVDPGLSFRRLLAWVKRDTLDAQAHQEVPFELLVEDLRPERHLSRNPLFQVSFVFQNLPGGSLELPDVELGSLPVERGLAKLDLTLEMTECEGGLAGYFEYNTDLFERPTIAALAERFLVLLAEIAAGPDRRIADLPLLTVAERRLVEAWSTGPLLSALPKPVHRAFAESARRAPEADAVVFADQRLTYAELRRRSRALAQHLRTLGVGPETRVGICLERSIDLPVAVLAVLEAGGAYVPLDPGYPRERLSFLVRDAEPRVLLTHEALAERLPASPATLRLDGAERPWEGAAFEGGLAEPVHPESTAYVIYTSGSTGLPKGVPVPHRALANHAAAIAARYELAPDDRVLQFASFSFDIAGEEIFPTWLAGAALVPRPAGLFPSFPELTRLIATQGITVTNLPTPYWHEWAAELARTGALPPAPLRLVIVGTEQASAERVAQWRALPENPVRWINAYGPTEATISATAHEPDAGAVHRPRVPIGSPLAGVRAWVLDAELQPVPPGVVGELCLGGAGVARGYLHHPVRTAEVFVPDPHAPEPGARLYRTGDRARFLPAGEIEFLGRADDQVKIRGFRVEPGEVEAVLGSHPEVRQAVVIAREDGLGGLRLVGYVVPAPASGLAAEELRSFLHERLPDYMVPALVLLRELSLTRSGKVDRRALPAPGPADGTDEGFLPPRGALEEMVATIWAEILRRDRIGARDNFFSLGGHSLLATQVVSRLRDAFGLEIPLRTVFEEPTVAGLAAAIEKTRREVDGLGAAPVEPLPVDAPRVCSYAQQRLWFLDRLTPESPAYNMAANLRLQGELDAAALERALEEIVRRHESLRTRFHLEGGEPAPETAPHGPFTLPRTQVTTEDEARRRILEEALRPFDLARGPLFRAALLRLGAEDHVLLLTLHHIVSDGWSIDLLHRELAAVYTAFAAGHPSPLPEPAVQYTDYAAWQRRQLAGPPLERALAFWRERLAGSPVAIDLPFDRPRPPVQGTRGARATLRLDALLSGELRALARRQQATLFMLLLTGFDTFLSRLSGQEDVLVGTPVAGRQRRELEGVLGLFVNTLVLRADLTAPQSFTGLLARVREGSLDAYAHQDLPFERLVEELRPERHLAHNPVFQVFYVLHHLGGGGVRMPGLHVTAPSVDNHTARFDLSLSLADPGPESEAGIHGFLEYNAELFDPATVERFATHLATLLAAAAARPNLAVADLPLLTETERWQLVQEHNDTAAPVPAATLHEPIEALAARHPGAIALVTETGESLTYAELNGRANRLAWRLRGLGVAPGAVVALHAERSAGLVVALLAVLKAGGAYLPLDPSHPRERLAWVLQDSGATVLIADPGSVPPLPVEGPAPHLLPLESGTEAFAAEPDHDLEQLAGAEDLAYVLYTSGSTGRPKGVEVRHHGIANFLASMAREPGISSSDALLAVTTVSFDIAGLELWLPLCVGARVVLAGRETAASGARLAAALREHAITVLQATPATWRLLLDAGWEGSPRLVALCGGEALPPELAAGLTGRVGALWNVYGPTETTVWSTLRRVGREEVGADGGSLPIGRPLANTTAHVLDRGLEPVPPGVAGELYLGGAGLARGYLRRPELTSERFIPDPFAAVPGGRLYRTGDLVRRLASGELAFLGRADHQVKLRGYRIELGEVEAALARHPAVRQAVAGVRETVPGQPQLIAWLAAAEGTDPSVNELRGALRSELPDYMIPGVFVRLDTFPLTPSGKVDRKALPAPEGGRSRLGSDYLAPAGPVEEKLATLWSEVLRVDRVGARDNFFELGGHSLIATQVLVRVQDAFGVELPLRDLFENPTVTGLAERIVQAELQRADADLMARLLAELGA